MNLSTSYASPQRSYEVNLICDVWKAALAAAPSGGDDVGEDDAGQADAGQAKAHAHESDDAPCNPAREADAWHGHGALNRRLLLHLLFSMTPATHADVPPRFRPPNLRFRCGWSRRGPRFAAYCHDTTRAHYSHIVTAADLATAGPMASGQ